MERKEAFEILQEVWGKNCYEIIPECSELSQGVYSNCPYNGGYGIDRCSAHNCKAHIKVFRFNENNTLAGYNKTWFSNKILAEQEIARLNGEKK